MKISDQEKKDRKAVIEAAWIAYCGQQKWNEIQGYAQNNSRRVDIDLSGFAWINVNDVDLFNEKDKMQGLVWNQSGTRVRPVQLNGIGDNNGWIKIYGPEDLPSDTKLSYDYYDANRRTGVVRNQSDVGVRVYYQKEFVTHYRVNDSKLPIF